MFNFLKSKKTEQEPAAPAPKPEKKGLFQRLRQGLSKTRQSFSSKLSNLVLGKKTIDDALLEDLETLLLTADMGIETSQKILKNVSERVKRKQLSDPEALISALEQALLEMLKPYSQPFTATAKPTVILMVGVNGAGKTTTIAKLAHRYKQEGKQVMLAAGDTFRAAAIDQLQVWGERNEVPVIAQQPGADSASVIFDAMQSAQAKQCDVLIADTAGRLHTQVHLMAELEKIKRVIKKQNPDAPHETMLVIDATMGQNALTQAQQFHQSMDVSGITLTKLDGTAKGGIIFAITDELKIPVRYIGVGESIDDLQPFDAEAFVKALFNEN